MESKRQEPNRQLKRRRLKRSTIQRQRLIEQIDGTAPINPATEQTYKSRLRLPSSGNVNILRLTQNLDVVDEEK